MSSIARSGLSRHWLLSCEMADAWVRMQFRRIGPYFISNAHHSRIRFGRCEFKGKRYRLLDRCKISFHRKTELARGVGLGWRPGKGEGEWCVFLQEELKREELYWRLFEGFSALILLGTSCQEEVKVLLLYCIVHSSLSFTSALKAHHNTPSATDHPFLFLAATHQETSQSALSTL